MAQTIVTKVGTPSVATVDPPIRTSPLQVGADIAAMAACYVDSAGKIQLATAATGCMGFAPTAALNAQREALSLYSEFETQYGSGMTPGGNLYLGPIAGAIYTGTPPTTPAYSSPVGWVVSATVVRLFGNIGGVVI